MKVKDGETVATISLADHEDEEEVVEETEQAVENTEAVDTEKEENSVEE